MSVSPQEARMNRRPYLFTSLLFATLLTICLFAQSSAFGQVDTGSISGVVRDASGAVLPNATVTATNSATSAVRTVASAPDGGYTVPSLLPGMYDISITA